MSWFDEQLRYRKEKDQEQLNDSLNSIAAAVMGRRLTETYDAREALHSAIEEILKYYYCPLPKDELPSSVKTLEEELDYRMGPVGIMHRTVFLDAGWYRDAIGAMIGTLKESGTVVALMPDKVSGYSFVDVKTGKKTKVNKRTAQLLDREAICFYKPLPLRKITPVDLVKYMFQLRKTADTSLFVGAMIASTLLGLLSPLFTKWLFGDVLRSGDYQVLMALAAYILCFSITRILFDSFKQMITAKLQTRQNIALKAAVMHRVISLPPSFFKEHASGELISRMNYVESLVDLIIQSIGVSGLSSLLSLIYVGQIFAFAPQLVIPALSIVVLTLLFTLVTTFAQMKISKEIMETGTKTGGLTLSIISGIQKVKLAGAETRFFARWAKQYAKEAEKTYNPPLFVKLNTGINQIISLGGTMVLYYFAIKSKVSVEDYYAFTAAYGMVSGAFMAMTGIAQSIAQIRPTLDMAKPILDAEPEVSDGKKIVTSIKGSVEFQNVSFSYGEDLPKVIDDLSFHIKPGEYVAIVGKTGCGKSTLIRLLLGFEKASRGNILFDRKDIRDLDLQSLRQKIGVVMQDGKLFSGDVFSNIIISAPHLTQKEAWEAAEIASIADDIRDMPMGMNTLISEGQGGISGGQRQRLMIARAVAPKPKLLIFDEATSALDNLTQKKVTEAIDELKCTRIVIAHRLSTIRHADRILFLHEGKIVEQGTYEELIEMNGYFSELVERQRIDVDVD